MTYAHTNNAPMKKDKQPGGKDSRFTIVNVSDIPDFFEVDEPEADLLTANEAGKEYNMIVIAAQAAKLLEEVRSIQAKFLFEPIGNYDRDNHQLGDGIFDHLYKCEKELQKLIDTI